MILSSLVRVGLLAVATVGVGRAASITITNHSFETPYVDDGDFNVTAPPSGWTTYGTGITSNGARSVGALNPEGTGLYLDAVPDGRNVGVVFLWDRPPTGNFGGLTQTLTGQTLTAFTTYTLTVEIGNIKNGSESASWDFTGFPGYRIAILAGGVEIGTTTNAVLPGEGRFLTSTVELSVFADHAQLGQTLGVRLVNLGTTAGVEVNFDDVRLDATAIPEPASVATIVAVAGLVTAAGVRRWRGSRAA